MPCRALKMRNMTPCTYVSHVSLEYANKNHYYLIDSLNINRKFGTPVLTSFGTSQSPPSSVVKQAHLWVKCASGEKSQENFLILQLFAWFWIAFNVCQNSTLNFACIFGIQCCNFTICTCSCTSAIEHSSFQFLYSNCFTIQLCSLKYSTFEFTQFNIQVNPIQQ